jgi:hypothetical protein
MNVEQYTWYRVSWDIYPAQQLLQLPIKVDSGKDHSPVFRYERHLHHPHPTFLGFSNSNQQIWKQKKSHNTGEKSRIRETKHLSTDADRSTDAIGGWTKAKSEEKEFFFARQC